MKQYLDIIRPYALGFLALLVWNLSDGLSAGLIALLMGTAVFLTAGGFVMNDYFDVKIDRINRPELLVVTNSLTKKQAIGYSVALTAVGVLCGLVLAWLTQMKHIAAITIMMPGLMWFYSSSYKRMFVLGNLIIAVMLASVPVVVALCFEPVRFDLMRWAIPLFLLGWTTILLLDIRDQEGERELECHTIPVVFGDVVAKAFLIFLALATVGTAVYMGFFAK